MKANKTFMSSTFWLINKPNEESGCDKRTVELDIQEFVGFGTPAMNSVFKFDLTFDDGLLNITDAPGLGVDFDEAAAAKYPYKRSYLPLNRLEDGTMWGW